MNKWIIHKEGGGLPIERAKKEPFYYLFILTSESKTPWFIYKIRRHFLDDQYRTENEDDTLEHANSGEELERFIAMAVKMQSLGFRSSVEGERYEISESQFQRFFK